jgi:hypothetical protein
MHFTFNLLRFFAAVGLALDVVAGETGSMEAEPTHSMGFTGCSMSENVAQGYVAVGGQRMWGPYGTSGMVV